MSSFPTLYRSYLGSNNRCLAVLNVPPDFSLADTMCYFRIMGPRRGSQGIRLIIRTIEAGEPIYWIGFSTFLTARIFRGRLVGCYVPGYPPCIIEFIHGDVYSARASWARESWSQNGVDIGTFRTPAAPNWHLLAAPQRTTSPVC